LGFSWLLHAIKSCFKGQSLILCAPNVLVVIIFPKNNQNYSSIELPKSRSGFWSHRA
jgi:hypothetical protein